LLFGHDLRANAFAFVARENRFTLFRIMPRCKESPDMRISKRLLLGLGLATLLGECLAFQPALAADKVSLFKVITTRDEIVIGIPEGELAKMDGNAGGVAKALVANGSLSVWQYAVRKSSSGDLEQAPLHKIGLISRDSLRIEPYASPLKVLPIEEVRR
jgi:hypothetical protein